MRLLEALAALAMWAAFTVAFYDLEQSHGIKLFRVVRRFKIVLNTLIILFGMALLFGEVGPITRVLAVVITAITTVTFMYMVFHKEEVQA